MINKLFVYGTLAPGESNAHFLQQLNGQWQAATVRGKLHPKGIGPTRGYPALQLNIRGNIIQGQLVQLSKIIFLMGRTGRF